MEQKHLVDQGLLVIEALPSHSVRRTPLGTDDSGRVIGPTQRPPPDDARHSQKEHACPASEREQTHGLGRGERRNGLSDIFPLCILLIWLF
jgi:hypothetical protein